MCVQRFDDSQISAIHTTFRASLRSSSMREPRDPLLKVLNLFFVQTKALRHRRGAGSAQAVLLPRVYKVEGQRPFVNDPSAGSPTETLLRLLLPLNDQV
jgi:hypothetical protein